MYRLRIIVIGTYLAVLAASANACSGTRPDVSAARQVRAQCPPATATDYFFPADIALAEIEVDPRAAAVRERTNLPTTIGFFSPILAATREPSLSCGYDPSVEAYRLMWYRAAVSNTPVVIRVTRDGRSWSLRTAGVRNLAAPTMAWQAERTLSNEESEFLHESLLDSQFWTAPAFIAEGTVEDGGVWVLEGRRAGGYHAIARRPEPDMPARTLALALARVSSLEVADLMGDGNFLRDLQKLR